MVLRTACKSPKPQKEIKGCELSHHFRLEGTRLVVFEYHVAGKRVEAAVPQWLQGDQE